MRVFISGGLGQIGSHVAEAYLHRGDDVQVMDDLSTGRRGHLTDHPKLHTFIGTISDRASVFSVMEKFRPEVVVHAAASFKNPHDWYNDTMTNCVGGINLIQASEKLDVKRFTYLQTSLCYGQATDSSPITLAHEIKPSGSSYAISKTVTEYYLQLSKLDFVSFRLANVIGPRNVAGPLPIFYQRIKNGTPCIITNTKRDFVDVRDLTRLILQAGDGIGNGFYHFSSGRSIWIKELYELIKTSLPLCPNIAPILRDKANDDVFDILLDPSKTMNDFGTIRFTPLKTTIGDAIAYYEQHGIKNEFTHLQIK